MQANAYLLTYNTALAAGWCASHRVHCHSRAVNLGIQNRPFNLIRRECDSKCIAGAYILFLVADTVYNGGWTAEVYEVSMQFSLK